LSIKVLVAGGTASGKSMIAGRIADRTGYPTVSFGECLRNYARYKNLSLSVESLQNLGQGLIAQLGYDKFLHWVIAQSPHVRWEEPLILDGVRHAAMYEAIKKVFPRNNLVYCACDPETQISRMVNRDRISKEEAISILSHPLERFIADMEPQSNLVFRPEDSLEDFLARLDALIKQR